MRPSSPRRFHSGQNAQRCSILAIAGAVIVASLTACTALNGWAQIGPDLRPSIGSSVSIPLGK
jgi:hypothetical protein